MIVLFLAKIRVESFDNMHVVDDGAFKRARWTLVGHIVRIGLLELWGCGAEGKEGEKVVCDMVLDFGSADLIWDERNLDVRGNQIY